MDRRTSDEAADWFAQICEPHITAQIREDFANWLTASPNHVRAYLETVRTWGALHLPGHSLSVPELVNARRAKAASSNVVQLASKQAPEAAVLEELPHQQRPARRASARAKYSAVAAFVLAAAIGLGWIQYQEHKYPTHVQTSIGEQRTIPMKDGSSIHLNTDSEVRIALTEGERRITLIRGEGRFSVAKDPNRPFIVATPHASVRALGTVFNVQIAQSGTAVAVLEGHIEVKGNEVVPEWDIHAEMRMAADAPERVELRTGQKVSVTPQGQIVPNGGPPIERIMGWPEHRLVFRDETVSDLVDEFNRYHDTEIRIADPQIGKYTVSGTFNAYDRESLLDYLEQFQGVQVEQSRDGRTVTLHAKRPQDASR